MSKQKNNGNPFPGLRPFESHENHLFFGRDGQSDELIRRLRKNRFLAVVGTSGSGKSSLVRAGLLPALHGGFMAGAGSYWRIALFRPGGNPIGNLAAALCKSRDTGTDESTESNDDPAVQIAMTEATLRRSDVGVVEAVKQTGISKDENLLIVVDQFEELFRFKASADVKDAHNEAAAFVKLLLSATTQKDVPIYVGITMRSDYLGDCAQFRDLPEAINDSQYLIPRMTRDQRRQAITGPIAVGGAQITERLVQQLLNDVGDNPDQLPILQHALMRTWDFWQRQNQNNVPIDLDHYDHIGRMEHALSNHADEAFNELAENQSKAVGKRRQMLAEKLFRCITELGSDNREIRRPTKLNDICEIVHADENEMTEVINVFRKQGRCFLMPPQNTELNKDSLIDISHESLIRNWRRLKKWVNNESESAHIFRRLAETAQLYNEGKASLYRNPELQLTFEWYKQQNPNKNWAQRYHSNFNSAIHFLDSSKKAHESEVRKKRLHQRRKFLRIIIYLIILCFVFSIGLISSYFYLNKIKKERDKYERLWRAGTKG